LRVDSSELRVSEAEAEPEAEAEAEPEPEAEAEAEAETERNRKRNRDRNRTRTRDRARKRGDYLQVHENAISSPSAKARSNMVEVASAARALAPEGDGFEPGGRWGCEGEREATRVLGAVGLVLRGRGGFVPRGVKGSFSSRKARSPAAER
jgi:hypothetical protein